MKYKQYWSIADLGTNSIKSYEVCIYIAVLFLIVFLVAKRFMKSKQDYEKAIVLWATGIFCLGGFICFVYLKFFTIDTTNERIQQVLNNNNATVVEGVISEFESVKLPSKRNIVTQESFVVDSVDFIYSDELLGRFNRFSDTNNGVFRNGLPVRITYGKVNHDILVVEVGE